MEFTDDELILAADAASQRDGLIKGGIRYGLMVKKRQKQPLTADEQAVATKLSTETGARTRDKVTFTPQEAGAALACLIRSEAFLRRTDSFNDDDRIAWGATPQIQDFVTAHGIEVASD